MERITFYQGVINNSNNYFTKDDFILDITLIFTHFVSLWLANYIQGIGACILASQKRPYPIWLFNQVRC